MSTNKKAQKSSNSNYYPIQPLLTKENTIPIDENQKITPTREIKDLLRITFDAFDTNKSGKLIRQHESYRVQKRDQNSGFQNVENQDSRAFQGV